MGETYWIPEVNVEAFEKGLAKVNKVADKLSLPPVTYKQVGEEFRTVTHEGRKLVMKYVELEVEGERPQINGYTLVAILERNKDLNLVNHIDKSIELPDGVEETVNLCDHCHSNRNRKYIYLFWKVDSGGYIRVGKSCAKDFLGSHASPEWLAEYHKYVKELEDCYRWYSGFVEGYVDVVDVLAHSIYFTDLNGYVRDYGYRANSRDTIRLTARSIENMETTRRVVEDAGAYAKVPELMAWINEQDKEADYYRNLQTLIKDEMVRESKIGILASAYHSRNKAAEKEERSREYEDKKKREAELYVQSEYVGNVGERKTYGLVYHKKLTFESQYGDSYMYFFFDSDNNVFVWSTSKYLDLTSGDVIHLTGTLKDHHEYNGVKQNMITRCKVVEAS
ncbi:MAG: hypothetical protein ACI35P_15010 [Bacillus sp. (in: firmicutes)]